VRDCGIQWITLTFINKHLAWEVFIAAGAIDLQKNVNILSKGLVLLKCLHKTTVWSLLVSNGGVNECIGEYRAGVTTFGLEPIFLPLPRWQLIFTRGV
jgi:hypothetical protein